MRLKVSAEDAVKLLRSIPHSTCGKAIDDHWKVDSNGTVQAQSVLWLFCWAKTGMNSETAREAAVRVLNEILPASFPQLDAVIDHAYARKMRYEKSDIELEFNPMVQKAANL